MENPIRVLLYEDNEPLRTSLSRLITATPGLALVAALGHCAHAEKEVQQWRPDVVLMDIDLPGRTGLEAAQGIKRTVAEPPQVLMLTVFDDNDRVFQALCNGADGYLLKKTAPDQLVAAIRDVQQGGVPMSPSVARQVLRFFPSQPANSARPAPVSPAETASAATLTPREQQVLNLLVDGFSYKMIAAECGIGLETVRSHIKRIYEKLHVSSATEAVSKALRHGYS